MHLWPAVSTAGGTGSEQVEALRAKIERARKDGRLDEMAELAQQARGVGPDNESGTVAVLDVLQFVAESFDERGEEQAAQTWYRRSIEEAEKRGVEPGHDAAAVAAESAFMVAEYDFRAWQSIRLEGGVEEQKKALERLLDGAKAIRLAYERVHTYDALEWTLAANHRVGQIYEVFAEKMILADNPFPAGSEEFGIYRDQLFEYGRPFEDAAIARYRKNVQAAKRAEPDNEWVMRSRRALRKWFPNRY